MIEGTGWHLYVILRGSRVWAGVGIGTATSTIPSQFPHVVARVPLVTVSATPPVTATVMLLRSETGPPLLTDWWLCPGDIPANGVHVRSAEPVSPEHVAPSCGNPVAWHGLIGWLNHSVARIDYSAP